MTKVYDALDWYRQATMIYTVLSRLSNTLGY